MALTAVVMKDVLDGDDLSATILSEARSALQPFEVSATSAEEDDDDILIGRYLMVVNICTD